MSQQSKPTKYKEKPRYEYDNICRTCGGKKTGFTDDYFIKGCHCDEIKEMEKGYDDDEYF